MMHMIVVGMMLHVGVDPVGGGRHHRLSRHMTSLILIHMLPSHVGHRRSIVTRLQRQNLRHFVLVKVVDVLVDGVASELNLKKVERKRVLVSQEVRHRGHKEATYLTESKVHRGRFTDVHNLAIWRHHKYESIQCLQQV